MCLHVIRNARCCKFLLRKKQTGPCRDVDNMYPFVLRDVTSYCRSTVLKDEWINPRLWSWDFSACFEDHELRPPASAPCHHLLHSWILTKCPLSEDHMFLWSCHPLVLFLSLILSLPEHTLLPLKKLKDFVCWLWCSLLFVVIHLYHNSIRPARWSLQSGSLVIVLNLLQHVPYRHVINTCKTEWSTIIAVVQYGFFLTWIWSWETFK